MTNLRNKLTTYMNKIMPLNIEVAQKMEHKIDNLTKPVGALGAMELLLIQLSGIYGYLNIELNPKVTIIMCADNGICEEQVSSCPQEVTKTVTENFVKGITAMNQLAQFTKSDLHIVDIGVKGNINLEEVHHRKIAHGTKNMRKEPAMTYEQALEAIWIGIEETEKLIQEGYQMFGTGEMGIGNTTTSAAVLAALLDVSVEDVTGHGAGASTQTYTNKVNSIIESITQHQPNPNDAIDVLSKVGGFDLAGLVGVYLACAKNKKPVIIDGFISGVAAVVASKLMPLAKEYMIASHLSEELGMKKVLETLGKDAYLNLKMRLGEGSGCPIMFQLIDLSVYTLLEMGTFEEAGVDATDYKGIWK